MNDQVLLDPYVAFEWWCRANGYADALDGPWVPERMTAAVDGYHQAGAEWRARHYEVIDPHQGWAVVGVAERKAVGQ